MSNLTCYEKVVADALSRDGNTPYTEQMLRRLETERQEVVLNELIATKNKKGKKKK